MLQFPQFSRSGLLEHLIHAAHYGALTKPELCSASLLELNNHSICQLLTRECSEVISQLTYRKCFEQVRQRSARKMCERVDSVI